jgi:hypothetical protein
VVKKEFLEVAINRIQRLCVLTRGIILGSVLKKKKGIEIKWNNTKFFHELFLRNFPVKSFLKKIFQKNSNPTCVT